MNAAFPAVRTRPSAWPAWAFGAGWAVLALLPLALGVAISVLQHRGFHLRAGLSLQAYRDLAESGRLHVIGRTVAVAAGVSLLCLLCALPLAMWLARRRHGWLAQLAWMSLTLPFFLDPSARTLVLRIVLSSGGIVNQALMALHLTRAPLPWLLFSDFAVGLGLVGPYFSNSVWPIYLALTLIDPRLLEASADLGATDWQGFRAITWRLALPGVLAAAVMTFIPLLGDNVVPDLLGGGRQEYIADAVLSLSTAMNETGACAMASSVFALLGLLCLCCALLRRWA